MNQPDAIIDFAKWFGEDKKSAKFIISVKNGHICTGSEEVWKMNEIDKETADHIRSIVDKFRALRINIICNTATNAPDRIEVYSLRG